MGPAFRPLVKRKAGACVSRATFPTSFSSCGPRQQPHQASTDSTFQAEGIPLDYALQSDLIGDTAISVPALLDPIREQSVNRDPIGRSGVRLRVMPCQMLREVVSPDEVRDSTEQRKEKPKGSHKCGRSDH